MFLSHAAGHTAEAGPAWAASAHRPHLFLLAALPLSADKLT